MDNKRYDRLVVLLTIVRLLAFIAITTTIIIKIINTDLDFIDFVYDAAHRITKFHIEFK